MKYGSPVGLAKRRNFAEIDCSTLSDGKTHDVTPHDVIVMANTCSRYEQVEILHSVLRALLISKKYDVDGNTCEITNGREYSS